MDNKRFSETFGGGAGLGQGFPSLRSGFYKIFRLPFNLRNLNKTHPNSPLQKEGVKAAFTLAEVFSPHSKGQRKVAFTLAEVLITLGIIGVVAALTMPTLIQKYREQVTVNKVKKFYSTMSQAIQMSIKDNGYLDEWEVTDGINAINSAKAMDYLKPYLNIVNDCGTKTDCFTDYSPLKSLRGSALTDYLRNAAYYKAVLTDGTLFWFRTTPEWCRFTDSNIDNVCITFWVDVNGIQNPNVLGKDIFLFHAVKNGLYTPQLEDCSLTDYGWGCSSEIITKGNMDYLHK